MDLSKIVTVSVMILLVGCTTAPPICEALVIQMERAGSRADMEAVDQLYRRHHCR